jgi:HK97 family phage portal protein
MIVAQAAAPSGVTYNGGKTIDQIFGDLMHVNGAAIIPENVEKLGAVSAAHRIFTNSIAAMPWMIRRKTGEERLEAEHSVAKYLKDRANLYMTAFTAEKVVLSRAFFYGVGYALIERDENGMIAGLLPIPLEPEIRVNRRDGVRWYKFTVPETNIFAKELTGEFTDSQLLVYRFESYDGSSGRGILQLAREAMGTDLKAQKYADKFYTNGARTSGIVEVDGRLDKDKRDMLREEFREKYTGDNAFKVAIMDLGMKYTQLGISQTDAQYIESRQFTVSEISRFTGIPAYMMQEGKQSYNSNEQQKLDFLVDTLTPHLVQIEQEWAYKLFSQADRDSGMYLKKNVAGILRGTHEQRANFYEKMISIGATCADEIRAAEDKSPVPGGWGKKFWMSKNFAPVDMPEAFNTSGTANQGKEEE